MLIRSKPESQKELAVSMPKPCGQSITKTDIEDCWWINNTGKRVETSYLHFYWNDREVHCGLSTDTWILFCPACCKKLGLIW